MSDETTPGLREQMIRALTAVHYQRSRQGILASPEIHNAAMADAALAVVRPNLDQRDAEIARLRAGESEQPAPEGQVPTPAEWIHKFNRTTAEQRLTHIETMLTLTEQAIVCWHQDHASLKAQLDEALLREQVAVQIETADLFPHEDGCSCREKTAELARAGTPRVNPLIGYLADCCSSCNAGGHFHNPAARETWIGQHPALFGHVFDGTRTDMVLVEAGKR